MTENQADRAQNLAGRAGAAAVDITPDFPVELVGGYRPDPRTAEVLHPLSAEVLVLETGGVRDEAGAAPGARVCLVSVDSLGWTVALTDEIRAVIAVELGIDVGAVLVSFTHTHSAPAPLSETGGARYRGLLTERLVEGARTAADRLRPCVVAWAVGSAGVAENRRAGSETIDDRLGALLVAGADDHAPIALVVRAAAHANILLTSAGVSADYVGIARQEIEEDFGCPMLFVQGAAGNLKPAGVDAIRGGDVADARRVAGRLAERVRGLRARLEAGLRPLDVLATGSRRIELIADVPTAHEAERIAREAREQAGIDGSGWLAECSRLRAAGVVAQVKTRELHALRVNEGCLAGLPDELFCELALSAAEQAGTDLFFLNGYTNGCTGYLATREEWAKGGYEPVYSYLVFYPFHDQVASFRPGSAERIVERAVEVWREVMRTPVGASRVDDGGW